MDTKQIKECFNDLDITYTLVSKEETEVIIKNWLKYYAYNVKKETGDWIFNKFKWHGFSSEIQASLIGTDAVNEYSKQYLTDYYIFGGSNRIDFLGTVSFILELLRIQSVDFL